MICWIWHVRMLEHDVISIRCIRTSKINHTRKTCMDIIVRTSRNNIYSWMTPMSFREISRDIIPEIYSSKGICCRSKIIRIILRFYFKWIHRGVKNYELRIENEVLFLRVKNLQRVKHDILIGFSEKFKFILLSSLSLSFLVS